MHTDLHGDEMQQLCHEDSKTISTAFNIQAVWTVSKITTLNKFSLALACTLSTLHSALPAALQPWNEDGLIPLHCSHNSPLNYTLLHQVVPQIGFCNYPMLCQSWKSVSLILSSQQVVIECLLGVGCWKYRFLPYFELLACWLHWRFFFFSLLL